MNLKIIMLSTRGPSIAMVCFHGYKSTPRDGGSVVAWGGWHPVRGREKNPKEAFSGGVDTLGYIHYLDHGDGVTGTCMSELIRFYALNNCQLLLI